MCIRRIVFRRSVTNTVNIDKSKTFEAANKTLRSMCGDCKDTSFAWRTRRHMGVHINDRHMTYVSGDKDTIEPITHTRTNLN